MKKERCTLEKPLEGHSGYWNYSYKFKYPVCPKCGLVVEPK